MDQNILDKKTEIYKTATGVIAIITMLFWAYHIIQDLEYISFIIVRDAVSHVSIFDLVDYVSILNWVLIRPIIMIGAMVLCVIYVFVYYGKKKSYLLGLSAALIALWYVFTLSMSVVFRIRVSSFTASYIIDTLASTIVLICFINYHSVVKRTFSCGIAWKFKKLQVYLPPNLQS